MSLRHLCSVFILAFGVGAIAPAMAEDIPGSVHAIVPSLQDWGRDPVPVAAVRQQNARGQTLDQIAKLDVAWIAESGVTPFMEALMTNEAARELKTLEGTQPYFVESFLMDHQGANVAMTNKTSDYWQGDEDKFTASYLDGQGAVHIGPVKFDSSAQTYLVQVSVPVLDAGRAIGALTIGIDLDRLTSLSQ